MHVGKGTVVKASPCSIWFYSSSLDYAEYLYIFSKPLKRLTPRGKNEIYTARKTSNLDAL